MAGLLVNGGESIALQYLTGAIASQGLTCRLFQNNHTPVPGDVVGAYTEATFTGYAALALTPGSWVESGGNPTTATYPAIFFQSTADQTLQIIYGYYLTRSSGGELIIAEAFATPIHVQYNGDRINLTPVITAL